MMQESKDTVERNPSEALVWQALSEISDPEIPVLSLLDLKIVRSVRIERDRVSVEITPTFIGCPALDLMKKDIETKLMGLGFQSVEVVTNLAAPWSTALLDDSAKAKLRAYGVAPPPLMAESLPVTLSLPVRCPFCGSPETHLESPFGPTLCRQIFYCDRCQQSFERFKPL